MKKLGGDGPALTMPHYVWRAQDRNEWDQNDRVLRMPCRIAQPGGVRSRPAVDRQTNE